MKDKDNFYGELLMYPCPTILVTSKCESVEDILTVSWSGIASSHPEYITIAINRKRFSYNLIRTSMKFCANIPNMDLIHEVDYCGSVSGRSIDKFQSCGLIKEYYEDYISVKQCPMSILCEVETIVELGSHDLFVGKVMQKLINRDIKDLHGNLDPIVYFRPNYYRLNKMKMGYYGFSLDA